MVVGGATGATALVPPALEAVTYLLGIGLRRRGERGEQVTANLPRIGGAIGQPVWPAGTVAGDDRQELRRTSLQDGKAVGIHGHLQQRGDLDLSRQLRVRHVVGPVAQRTGPVRPLLQEIGVTAPDAVEEGGLVDNVDAGPHRGQRVLLALAEVAQAS